ncbi:radical SAM family heme chaperone HemW [Neomoorella thermoacetica]|uniref:radical SAM family heme chaperone HemW n=1 Tax=Neomoorella thermoacetica TaxID=1525 RepID=UPI00090836E5|nr:radical SAM family heme chaperone HemW [Moorella thermoacetica]APC07702.1 oxygen-independent coproporphyrinogen-III oxidase-like protein YqeR [Moorella thermoacetica]OIQ53593.1 oxygen-independent coproporphyrinogen-III oxidase-like protein YqeR [Moorella thermoacetica]
MGTMSRAGFVNKASHIYIHIPFCVRKCNYCDFISYPEQSPEVMAVYCRLLEEEMKLAAGTWQPGPAATVFLGGGTPTILPADLLERILVAVEGYFNRQPEAEVSVEANPGTITLEKLRVLRSAGVNRLSLGVQSFDDRLLKAMGRIHRRRDIYQAYHLARRAGFANINLDLIFGLPGQTLEDWQATLREALALQPEHLAAYSLQVEEDTPWGRLAAAGNLNLPGEELELAMYQEAREKLAAAGYQQYEISNFARPGHRCRHNVTYWLNHPYLGLGAAAASSWRGERWQNYKNLEQYGAALSAGQLPRAEIEVTTPRQQMAETMFMGLRLLAGVNLQAFRQRFGKDAREVYAGEMERLLRAGLVEVRGHHLKLTERGLPLANEVFAAFV